MRAITLTITTIAVIIVMLVAAFLILRFVSSELDWAIGVTDETTPEVANSTGGSVVDIANLISILGECKADPAKGETVIWRCSQPAPFDNEECVGDITMHGPLPAGGFSSKSNCSFGERITVGADETDYKGCRFRGSNYDKPCICKCEVR